MKAPSEDQCACRRLPQSGHPGRFVEFEELDAEAEQCGNKGSVQGREAREQKADQPKGHRRVENVARVFCQQRRQVRGELARGEAKKDGDGDEKGVGEAMS